MRNLMRGASIAAVAVLLGTAVALPVQAQQTTQMSAAQKQPAGNAAKAQQPQNAQQQARIPILTAADVVGRAVNGRDGHDAGRIDSMIVDTKNGTVSYVLIAGRGQFDLKGQLIAVPWSVLDQPSARGPITIKVAAKQLAKAPRISRNITYRLVAPAARSRIYGYYGRPYPYYGAPGWYWPYRRPYAPMAGGNYAYQSQAANVHLPPPNAATNGVGNNINNARNPMSKRKTRSRRPPVRCAA